VVLLGNATEGTNRMNQTDANGFRLVEAIIKAGLAGGGYTDYWFPKAGTDVPLPKRGYSRLNKSWNWVVGTGAYVDDIDVIVKEKKDAALAARNRALLITCVLALIITAFTTGITVLFGKRIAKPVIYAKDHTERFAHGRFTERFDPKLLALKDETGMLLQSLNLMRERLGTMIAEVSAASDKLGSGSGELSNTAQEVADGASEQAASAEEVSASVEQMTTTIHQNADNAVQTEQIGMAIQQLDNVVQRNAAASEELSASAHSLNDQAAILRESIARFEI